jgi:hypothetical protein
VKAREQRGGRMADQLPFVLVCVLIARVRRLGPKHPSQGVDDPGRRVAFQLYSPLRRGRYSSPTSQPY